MLINLISDCRDFKIVDVSGFRGFEISRLQDKLSWIQKFRVANILRAQDLGILGFQHLNLQNPIFLRFQNIKILGF